jgi:hypothetical protein
MEYKNIDDDADKKKEDSSDFLADDEVYILIFSIKCLITLIPHKGCKFFGV